jgi:hypothetical protein
VGKGLARGGEDTAQGCRLIRRLRHWPSHCPRPCRPWRPLPPATSGQLVKRAARAILITGTPLLSRPIEIWPQVDMLRPGLLGGFDRFGERHCQQPWEQQQAAPQFRGAMYRWGGFGRSGFCMSCPHPPPSTPPHATPHPNPTHPKPRPQGRARHG